MVTTLNPPFSLVHVGFSRRWLIHIGTQKRHSFLRRRWRSWFRARHGRVFFDVAGGGPFGEFRRIVFVGVLDDGVQHMQRNDGSGSVGLAWLIISPRLFGGG